MNILHFYETQVLPNLDKKALLSDLYPQDRGSYYALTCPNCKSNRAFMYKKSDKIVCNRRNNCNYYMSLLGYLNNGVTPKGKEFVDVVIKAAQISNISYEQVLIEHSPQELEKFQEKEQRQKLLNDFLSVLVTSLNSDIGTYARAYLASRSWQEHALEDYEFGFYPTHTWIQNKMLEKGYLPSDLAQAGLYREDWSCRVVYPWRDAQGNIINFWARDIRQTSNSESAKYLLLSGEKGASKALPFGFNWLESKDIVLVEGFFDALNLKAHGITNVVALGGSALTAEQYKNLVSAGISSITLLFDNDQAGNIAALREIDKLANTTMPVFIVPPYVMRDYKDPDEFLRTFGPEGAQFLINSRIHAYKFKAWSLVEQHKTGAYLTDFDKVKIFQEAAAFDERITQPFKVLDLDVFWHEIIAHTQSSPEAVELYRESIAQKKLLEQEYKQQDNFALELQGFLSAGERNKASELILKQADALKALRATQASKPVMQVSAAIEKHDEYLAQFNGKPCIGLQQHTLKALDELTLGLRKLIILAAAPNVGKTALAVQLALDAIINNTDACLLFLSLEMSDMEILSRMRCNLAQMTWRTMHFGSDPEKISGSFYTPEEQENLESSKELLRQIGPRIVILDSQSCPDISLDIVLAHVEKLKKKTGCSRAMVVVDYLQVWPVPEAIHKQYGSDIELDKWRVAQMNKLKQAINEDPVIAISECRKPGSSSKDWSSDIDMADVMGSARGVYTPDGVLLLAPLSNEELSYFWEQAGNLKRDHDDYVNGGLIRAQLNALGYSIIRLKLDKGREGMLKGECLLVFEFFSNRFREIEIKELLESLQQI